MTVFSSWQWFILWSGRNWGKNRLFHLFRKSLDYYFLRKGTACLGKGKFKSEWRKVIALNWKSSQSPKLEKVFKSSRRLATYRKVGVVFNYFRTWLAKKETTIFHRKVHFNPLIRQVPTRHKELAIVWEDKLNDSAPNPSKKKVLK